MSKLEGTLFKQSSYNSGPEGENLHKLFKLEGHCLEVKISIYYMSKLEGTLFKQSSYNSGHEGENLKNKH